MRRRTTLLGGALWITAAAAWLAALVVGDATSSVPYSSVSQLVSDLGRTTCGPVAYPWGPVEVCSPLHMLVNALGVVAGAAVAVGAVLLRPWLEGRRHEHLSMWLLVVAGVGRVGFSVVPVDVDGDLHAWFRLATTLGGGLALLVIAVMLLRSHRVLAALAVVLGLLSLAAIVLTSIPATWTVLPLGIASRASGALPLAWLAIVGLLLVMGRGGSSVDEAEGDAEDADADTTEGAAEPLRPRTP